MAKKGKVYEEGGRRIARKREAIIATMRDTADRKDFETRFRAICEEAGMKTPPMIPHGSGEDVTIACKNLDQAILLQDFAEEAAGDMPQ